MRFTTEDYARLDSVTQAAVDQWMHRHDLYRFAVLAVEQAGPGTLLIEHAVRGGEACEVVNGNAEPFKTYIQAELPPIPAGLWR